MLQLLSMKFLHWLNTQLFAMRFCNCSGIAEGWKCLPLFFLNSLIKEFYMQVYTQKVVPSLCHPIFCFLNNLLSFTCYNAFVLFFCIVYPFFIFLCTGLMCCFKLLLDENFVLHKLQENGLFVSWTLSTCTFKFRLVEISTFMWW